MQSARVPTSKQRMPTTDFAVAPGPPPDAAGAGDGTADGRGAYSANSERAQQADRAVYGAWCRDRLIPPAPVVAETLAAFVEAMAEVRAPATVRRYVASVALAERAAGRASPANHHAVRLALKRMHRQLGRRQRQVRGLDWPLRQRLLAAAGDRLIDARDRALIGLAYDAMLRRSELAALAVDDLAVQPHGWATVLVRAAKNDAEGQGHRAYLAPDTVALVRHWLEHAQVAAGPLLRSVRKGGRVGARLHPGQVPRILKAMARRAGLQEAVVANLSGHSPRVGAAQDMIAAGIELPAILQAGRWKSAAMVSRYGEQLLAERGGAARLARLQQRV